ncbi:MAG TPA: CPBP family glutamic-type intramembrane protease [Anaerolineales bacterium]|nr:CPBP family glutamic-type intramembrane protease [Anaerolineales bacterium]
MIRQHPLSFFFGLTFLLSWLIWVPMALDHYSLLPFELDENFVLIVRLFGTLGPAIAASLVALIVGGRSAVRKLWSQIGLWRVSWTWYVAAALVFPVLVFVAAWLYNLLPGIEPLLIQQISPATLLVIMIIMTISVTGEEIGWRGFALPEMQKRWTALKTSLLLGTIHTLWHLPFWITLGELERYGWSYWLLSWAWILALTIYMTWILNNTGNSLLMILLFHFSLNVVSNAFLPVTTVVPAYLLLIGIAWLLALSILARYGPQRLVRSNSGTPGIPPELIRSSGLSD